MTSQERRDSGKLSTTLRLLEKSCRVRAAGSWRPAVCDPGHMGMQCPPPLDAGGVSVKPSAPAFALLGERGRKELFVSSTDESDPVANKFSGAALNSGSELWFQPADRDTACVCVCVRVCVCVCVVIPLLSRQLLQLLVRFGSSHLSDADGEHLGDVVHRLLTGDIAVVAFKHTHTRTHTRTHTHTHRNETHPAYSRPSASLLRSYSWRTSLSQERI